MDRDHRCSKKRPSRGKGVLSLVLSFSLFSGAIAANLPLYFGSPLKDSPFIPPQIPLGGSPSEGTHEFSLRHIFHRGTHEHPDLHQRLDVEPETRLMTVSEDGQTIKLAGLDTKLTASSNPITIQRLADRRPSVIEGYLQAARHTGEMTALSPEAWVMDTVQGPNVKSKTSVLTFAMMTANDYVEVPGTGKWHDLNRGRFNYSSSFGWHSDGLRGHIYADKTNSTVVISLKGTSPALFDGAGTTTNDKVNDNLFFSCCCGEGGSYLWRQSCDCMQSTYTANLTCIIEAMNDENRYYRASMDLFSNVTELYPNANVWLTGHSLGGAMSSLLGLTYGLPVVSFEAIPDALPASRLGLPSPPGNDPRFPQKRKFTGAYHFGHTADPIYTGTCNGIGSTCTWGGYALETACHTGFMCAYDTVTDLGWRSGIGTHRIESVITDVLKAYDTVPPCVPEEECYDCELWKFFRSNGSETTTTSSTSSATSTTWSSATRTSTCQTPGWWGCLDETTTTTGTTTSEPTTTTATTSTCKTPGWFGCYDSTTTTTATPAPTLTTTIPTETSTTTTCKTPGWFGCRDPTTTPSPSVSSPPVTATATDPATATATATATSSTCKSPGLFWGCWDSSTTANTNGYLITPAPAPVPPTPTA